MAAASSAAWAIDAACHRGLAASIRELLLWPYAVTTWDLAAMRWGSRLPLEACWAAAADDNLRRSTCMLLAAALMACAAYSLRPLRSVGPAKSQDAVNATEAAVCSIDESPGGAGRWRAPQLATWGTALLLSFCALTSIAAVGDGDPDHGSELLVAIGAFAAARLGASDFAAPDGPARALRLAILVIPGTAHFLIALVVSYGLAPAGSPARSRVAVAHHVMSAVCYVIVSGVAAWVVHLHQKSWGHYSAILQQLGEEEKHNDEVLSLLLPPAVMSSIKESQDSLCFAEEHDDVAVLFVELANFASIVSAMPPAKAMELLNSVFYEFDFLTTESGLLKVETVGSVYMVASGIPDGGADSCAKLGVLALKMRERVRGFNGPSGRPLEALMGIHAGPVIGGVIGYKLPRFRLFGDTVNTAARMETHSLPGEIGLSEAAANRISRSVALERAHQKTLEPHPAPDAATAVTESTAPPSAGEHRPPRVASRFQHLTVVDRGRKEIKSKGLVQVFFLREKWAAGPGLALSMPGEHLEVVAEAEPGRSESGFSPPGGSSANLAGTVGAGDRDRGRPGASTTGHVAPPSTAAPPWKMRFDLLLDAAPRGGPAVDGDSEPDWPDGEDLGPSLAGAHPGGSSMGGSYAGRAARNLHLATGAPEDDPSGALGPGDSIGSRADGCRSASVEKYRIAAALMLRATLAPRLSVDAHSSSSARNSYESDRPAGGWSFASDIILARLSSAEGMSTTAAARAAVAGSAPGPGPMFVGRRSTDDARVSIGAPVDARSQVANHAALRLASSSFTFGAVKPGAARSSLEWAPGAEAVGSGPHRADSMSSIRVWPAETIAAVPPSAAAAKASLDLALGKPSLDRGLDSGGGARRSHGGEDRELTRAGSAVRAPANTPACVSAGSSVSGVKAVGSRRAMGAKLRQAMPSVIRSTARRMRASKHTTAPESAAEAKVLMKRMSMDLTRPPPGGAAPAAHAAHAAPSASPAAPLTPPMGPLPASSGLSPQLSPLTPGRVGTADSPQRVPPPTNGPASQGESQAQAQAQSHASLRAAVAPGVGLIPLQGIKAAPVIEGGLARELRARAAEAAGPKGGGNDPPPGPPTIVHRRKLSLPTPTMLSLPEGEANANWGGVGHGGSGMPHMTLEPRPAAADDPGSASCSAIPGLEDAEDARLASSSSLPDVPPDGRLALGRSASGSYAHSVASDESASADNSHTGDKPDRGGLGHRRRSLAMRRGPTFSSGAGAAAVARRSLNISEGGGSSVSSRSARSGLASPHYNDGGGGTPRFGGGAGGNGLPASGGGAASFFAPSPPQPPQPTPRPSVAFSDGGQGDHGAPTDGGRSSIQASSIADAADAGFGTAASAADTPDPEPVTPATPAPGAAAELAAGEEQETPALALGEEDIAMDATWLSFVSLRTEADYTADRLEMKQASTTANALLQCGLIVTVALLLAPAASGQPLRVAAAAAILVAAVASTAAARLVVMRRLMAALYDASAGLTLPKLHARLRLHLAAGLAAPAALLAWAAALGCVGGGGFASAVVALTTLSLGTALFTPKLTLGLGGLLWVFYTSLLVREVWGAPPFRRWDALPGVPFVIALKLGVAFVDYWHHEREMRCNHRVQTLTQHRRNISQYLLSNMLPEEVIAEIRRSNRTSVDVRRGDTQLLAWSFPAVCVLQSDIVGFTKLGGKVSAEALCSFLHDLFSNFDEFCEELGCLKIETVGDAYIASTGCIPRGATGVTALRESARRLARLAAAMQALCATFTCPDGSQLQMRIGLVAGPAIGGVVGSSMLRYHLFGDLVSEVTSFEQACPVLQVLCSQEFKRALEHGSLSDSATPTRLHVAKFKDGSFKADASFRSPTGVRFKDWDAAATAEEDMDLAPDAEDDVRAGPETAVESTDPYVFDFEPHASQVVFNGAPRPAYLMRLLPRENLETETPVAYDGGE